MAELARRAAERGITLFLENEKGIYGDTAARVADILETVDSPASRMPSTRPTTSRSGSRSTRPGPGSAICVSHFHVKDYDAKLERNVPAGAGDGLIPRLLQEAVDGGYDGFAVLEPHLIIAGLASGFTGPERFDEAVRRAQGHPGRTEHRLRVSERRGSPRRFHRIGRPRSWVKRRSVAGCSWKRTAAGAAMLGLGSPRGTCRRADRPARGRQDRRLQDLAGRVVASTTP